MVPCALECVGHRLGRSPSALPFLPFPSEATTCVPAVAVARCDRNLVGMASGFGITGKKGRCYDVWMDFSDCMSHCSMPAECTSRRDDYFECLHHRKEYSRMNAINKEKERQAFGDKKEKSHDSSGH